MLRHLVPCVPDRRFANMWQMSIGCIASQLMPTASWKNAWPSLHTAQTVITCHCAAAGAAAGEVDVQQWTQQQRMQQQWLQCSHPLKASRSLGTSVPVCSAINSSSVASPACASQARSVQTAHSTARSTALLANLRSVALASLQTTRSLPAPPAPHSAPHSCGR